MLKMKLQREKNHNSSDEEMQKGLKTVLEEMSDKEQAYS